MGDLHDTIKELDRLTDKKPSRIAWLNKGNGLRSLPEQYFDTIGVGAIQRLFEPSFNNNERKYHVRHYQRLKPQTWQRFKLDLTKWLTIESFCGIVFDILHVHLFMHIIKQWNLFPFLIDSQSVELLKLLLSVDFSTEVFFET